jgi:hypothetical protein
MLSKGAHGLSDEEALQGRRRAGDVLDGHDVRDAVSATWSLLGNRLGAQAGVALAPDWLEVAVEVR